MFSPDQANECLNNLQQVVAVLKKEVTKTHNESEHEDIGGYRQVLFVRSVLCSLFNDLLGSIAFFQCESYLKLHKFPNNVYIILHQPFEKCEWMYNSKEITDVQLCDCLLFVAQQIYFNKLCTATFLSFIYADAGSHPAHLQREISWCGCFYCSSGKCTFFQWQET